MKTDIKEILDKLASVADWTDEEKTAVLSKLGEDTVIEGELGQSLLSKMGQVASRDFILNDAAEVKKLYDAVMGENMPKVEAGSREAFIKGLGGFIKESELDEIWTDPENKKLNNKVFKVNQLLKQKIEQTVEQAKKGPEELQSEVSRYKGLFEGLQSKIDDLSNQHEQQISSINRNHEVNLFGLKLMDNISKWGGDIKGLERGVALQVNNDYHVGLDESGNPYVRQKNNPELKITDKETGKTLGLEDVIKRDFAGLFRRNSGQQNETPRNKGQQSSDSGESGNGKEGQYPEGIKSDRQKREWDKRQRRKAQISESRGQDE